LLVSIVIFAIVIVSATSDSSSPLGSLCIVDDRHLVMAGAA
jgi:hypothetical protein